jgi:DNA-binding CsgD family transcriptional regulator
MLELYGHGWTYDQIGEDHLIKGATVRDYLRQARTALGVGTLDEAVTEAVRRGLIDLSGPRPVPSPPHWRRPYDPSR